MKVIRGGGGAHMCVQSHFPGRCLHHGSPGRPNTKKVARAGGGLMSDWVVGLVDGSVGAWAASLSKVGYVGVCWDGCRDKRRAFE